jgi:hypothetical protein
MTSDKEYEKSRQEVKRVFEDRKVINKKFLLACERKLGSLQSSTTTENPTKWIIGKLAFQEFEDVWDNFERLGIIMFSSIQNVDRRIERLEHIAVDLGGKIKSDDIASVSKFAKEFKQQLEESRKKLEEYKQKMRENDLAT